MEQAMERLSSGKRINSAMDDAAGLTIAHSLDGKIAGLNQAVRNANDGIAMINLAEGAMEEVSSMLTRMKELATQAMNGTYSSSDLANLNKEFQALSSEMERISKVTVFNGVDVLDSTTTMNFQVGDTASDKISLALQKTGNQFIGGHTTAAATSSVSDGDTTSIESFPHTLAATKSAVFSSVSVSHGQQLQVAIGDTTYKVDFNTSASETVTDLKNLIDKANLSGLTVTASSDDLTFALAEGADSLSLGKVETLTGAISVQSIDTAAHASASLAGINQAIQDIDSYRATMGAVANRMEHASTNLMSRVEHQSAARSRIQDADYAVESANLAKAQVLQQAGTAMLSQANASTQNVLSLLK
jgi:flagellin